MKQFRRPIEYIVVTVNNTPDIAILHIYKFATALNSVYAIVSDDLPFVLDQRNKNFEISKISTISHGEYEEIRRWYHLVTYDPPRRSKAWHRRRMEMIETLEFGIDWVSTAMH